MKFYRIAPCSAEDLNATEYERQYYKRFALYGIYCIKDPNNTLVLQGSINNDALGKTWSRL